MEIVFFPLQNLRVHFSHFDLLATDVHHGRCSHDLQLRVVMEQTVEEAEHFHSHQFTVHRQLDEKTRFRTVVVEDGSNIGVVALLQEQSHLEEHGVVFDEEGEDELSVFLRTAHEHESDCLVELANEGVEEGFEVEGGLVDFDQEEDGDLFVAEFEYLESVIVEVGFQFLGFGVGVSSQVLRESGEFND